MLVYIRDSDKDKIICNVDEKDIAEHLRVKCLPLLLVQTIKHKFCIQVSNLESELILFPFQIRLKKEQEEKEDKRRYKAQAHLYTIIKVKTFCQSSFNHFLFRSATKGIRCTSKIYGLDNLLI